MAQNEAQSSSGITQQGTAQQGQILQRPPGMSDLEWQDYQQRHGEGQSDTLRDEANGAERQSET